MFWRRKRVTVEEPDIARIQQVINDYGDALQSQIEWDGSRSARLLPASKDEIKRAISYVVKNTYLDDNNLESLGIGYVELCSFVEGGGPSEHRPNLTSTDIENSDSKAVDELIRQMATRSNFIDAVSTEREHLYSEWLVLKAERFASNA